MYKIVKPSVTLEWMTPDPLAVIERAGRTCYQSEPKGDPEDFVRMIMKRGHDSVLEHVTLSFRIVCDRGVTHELVRHRIMAYSQESTRYCRYGDGIQVIEPPNLTAEQFTQWNSAIMAADRVYTTLLDMKVSPQIARSVLPTCLKTEIVATGNLREWRHVLSLRMSKAAHPQMREIMGLLRPLIQPTVLLDGLHLNE